MELLATRDTWWMAQCEALLSAERIEARWTQTPGAAGALVLDVATSDADLAARLLSEMLGEEMALRAARSSLGTATSQPLLLQPAFAAALCFAALFVVLFWLTGPIENGSRYFARGALRTSDTGLHGFWRLVTAATLHADIEHVMGNAAFISVLGWATSERLGIGMMLAVWLATAVAGFLATLAFSDPGITLGASGGVFGLLGAAAGHAARHRHADLGLGRRQRLVGVAAAILLLAFTAFSPKANIVAHVGGFVAGLACGALVPAAPPKALWQVTAAAVWVACTAGAWWLALSMV